MAEEEDLCCEVCASAGDEALMLLCGDGSMHGCDRGFHTYCVTPRIKHIPEGDWFCPHCSVTKRAPKKPKCNCKTLGSLTRKELQALAKKYHVCAANAKSSVIIKALKNAGRN